MLNNRQTQKSVKIKKRFPVVVKRFSIIMIKAD